MLRLPHSTELRQHIPRAKRIYGAALLCGGLALSTMASGCANFFPQRPFTMHPAPQVLPPSNVLTNPSQVTPRTDQNTGKPVLDGIEELETNQTDEPQDTVQPEPTPTYRPEYSPNRDSEFLPNSKEEDDAKKDAPVWTPLRAPEDFDQNDPTAIHLGEPQQLPTTKSRPRAAEKSNSSTQAVSRSDQRWDLKLLSTGKQQLKIISVGHGEHHILVMGSIYGNDPESVELVESFQDMLERASVPANYTLVVIRTPNPDGLKHAVRTNLNGVDLNRNFPSTWFTANPNKLTGPRPASEIETQHLLRILKEFQPSRVIHVHNGIGHRPLVMLNEKWARGVDIQTLVKNVDSTTFGGSYKVGSIEEFTSVRMDAEMATIQLPPKGFQQLTPQELLQIAMQGVSSEEVLPPIPIASESHPPVPIEIQRPDGKKGYVDLLPPPPGSQFNQASSSTSGEDPRYYELPPPPGA